MRWLRAVPWWLWLLVLPAIPLGLNEYRIAGRPRVEIVGSGPLTWLRAQDAPPTARYALDTVPRESRPLDTRRLLERLKARPALIVFNLDPGPMSTDPAYLQRAKEAMADVVSRARHAATVMVVVAYAPPPSATPDQRAAAAALSAWWRRAICRREPTTRCLDLTPHVDDPVAVRTAVAASVEDAVRHLARVRAATQRS